MERTGRRRFVWAIAVAVALLSLPATSASASGAQRRDSTAPTYTWPQFHHDQQLSGYSPDPSLSTANASSLGVSWMTWTGAPALSSPVAAWNSTLSETLVYLPNEAGYLTAYDQQDGLPLWTDDFTGPMRSTPLVEGANLWVAPTFAKRLYKLDAATGAVECSAPLPLLNVDSSPTLGTPPGGRATIYIGVNDETSHNGPVVAVDEATCDVDFTSAPEPGAGTGGVWDGISYAVDGAGEGLVLFGTADPDSAVYAVDAITGQLVWRFATDNPSPYIYDVGAGITISPPGVNGFADGVAYAINKRGYLYALDLDTGAVLWQAHYYGGSMATPALDGDRLVVANLGTVRSVNATTGTSQWSTKLTESGIDGSPAIIGPPGSEIVVVPDLAGVIHVLSLATGTQLYSYRTGSFVTSSPSEVDGNLIEASADGFLYDLAVGGGNAAVASTAVTSPASGSTSSNPDGDLPISGTASTSDRSAIDAVDVEVQEGGSQGRWWDGATGTWVGGPYPNPAALADPGTSSTGWSLDLPIPVAGGSYTAYASAVDADGLADIAEGESAATSATSAFLVSANPDGPTASLASTYTAPRSIDEVSATGFAPDEQVQVDLDQTVLMTATANSSGQLRRVKIKIPASSPFGPAQIELSGLTSGVTANAYLYVTNTWAEAGGGPLRQNDEADDSVLAHQLAINHDDYLTQAWAYTGSGATTTSPAVVDGVAYYADDSGTVSAVNTRTGTTRWAAQITPGDAIDSSPAVDPGDGLVIVGTESGSVFALSTSNGHTVWSTPLGASVESSPAIVSGVVYVGSHNGGVSALDESTGTLVWQNSVEGSVHASPAVDSAAGLVVVGSSAGSVVALSEASGTVRWTFSAGASVTTLLIAGGAVFVGSGHEFFALNETSGSLDWEDATTGTVTSAAYMLSTLFVGDSDGILYRFNETNGSEAGSTSYGDRIVGVATVVGSTIGIWAVELAKGTVDGRKIQSGSSWSVTLGAPGGAAPVIIDGEVFATSTDGQLHCFIVPGSRPL